MYNLSHKKSIVSSYVDVMTIRNSPSNIVTPSNPILQNAFNVINDKICNCHAISSSSEGLLLTRDGLIDSMECPVYFIKIQQCSFYRAIYLNYWQITKK